MPSTHPLPETLIQTYPDLTFQLGSSFEWRPGSKTIVYDSANPEFEARLLHELGHALLQHDSYDRDIDLVAMERDAWQMARLDLAPTHGVIISGDSIQRDMDTYRDWLHERSTCPHCGSNGIQIKKHDYKCVTCLKSWRVNEARTCQLRRYKIT